MTHESFPLHPRRSSCSGHRRDACKGCPDRCHRESPSGTCSRAAGRSRSPTHAARTFGPMLSLSYDRPNLPAPPAIPGMDLAGNAREIATLLRTQTSRKAQCAAERPTDVTNVTRPACGPGRTTTRYRGTLRRTERGVEEPAVEMEGGGVMSAQP